MHTMRTFTWYCEFLPRRTGAACACPARVASCVRDPRAPWPRVGRAHILGSSPSTNESSSLSTELNPSVTATFEDCPAESWFLFGGILLHTCTGVVRNCRQVGAARPRQLVLPLLLRRTRRTQVHSSIVTRLRRASAATQRGRRTAERENQRSGCRRE